MWKKSLLGISVLVASIVGVGDAMAADAKVLPGLSCIRISGSTVFGSYGTGSITTANSSTAIIQCPLVRDDTAGVLNLMKVRVRDVAVANVSCTAKSINPADGSVVWDPTDSFITSGANTSWVEYTIDPSYDADFGSFILECALPAPDVTYGGSGILSYYWEED